MGRFNRPNIQLPGPQMQQPVGLMVSQPFNDLQLVMLLAAAIPTGTPQERIGLALDIVEEGVNQQFEIQKRVAKANDASAKRFQREQRASQGREGDPQEEPKGILVGSE